MTSDDLCEENVIKKKIEKKYDGSSSRSLFSIILSMNTFKMIIGRTLTIKQWIHIGDIKFMVLLYMFNMCTLYG